MQEVVDALACLVRPNGQQAHLGFFARFVAHSAC
jgi:hypothetical protein